MKKVSKTKKASAGSQKISDFFKKLSTGNERTPNDHVSKLSTQDIVDKKRKRSNVDFDNDLIECTPNSKSISILEQITNLPQCSKMPEPAFTTPENHKRIEDVHSPDIIPCSISIKELERYNKTIFDLNFKKNTVKTTKNVTPVKQKQCISEKKTPTKLFNRSPRSLTKFNVEVMENFVKLSPSKSELQRETTPPILFEEARKFNETTPTKTSLDLPFQNVSKAKQKLQFNECNNDVDCLLNDGWDQDLASVITLDHTLDLNKSQHCIIVNIQHSINTKTVILNGTKDSKSAVCDIEGFWTGLKLNVNDPVHITATFNKERSKWIVDNTNGSIVLHPDFLISTTSVVASQFCSRRSVLREKYYGFEPSNQVMIVGVLVHKLLQEVLRKGICTISEIEVVAKKLLFDQETKDDWKGKINEILDIEENIWCHELGVKGKVDVTIETDISCMPLEIKTGRATVSLEHRGQVMFYIMMMQKLGCKLSSGLLLYLREGVLREISISEKERRDLILLRNELAYYLTRKPQLMFDNPKGLGVRWELPEPINHHSACSKCPYNIICCTTLKYENANLTNNPLKDLQENLLTHLESQHVEYFMKWSALLSLESSSSTKSKPLHEIYTRPPAVREKNGQCIIGVKVKGCNDYGNLYEHTFCKTVQTDKCNMLLSGIGVGDYVVVSTDNRPAVAAGLELQKKYPNSDFHLDTYTSNMSQGFNMSNLALLLEPNEQAAKLRKIIIDKQPPTFIHKLSKEVAIKGTPILRRLNKMQQKAILKSLSSNDYLLINGMPGTGKTDTIVSLIKLLTDLNKSVLVTSHTHSAVDNVCVRLLACGVSILRLGSSAKIHSKLKSYSEEALTKGCHTPEQLEKVYNSPSVLAVTCLGSGHPILRKRMMDVCVVDESTQVLQCSVFRALYSARKFILIGDPDQLPPIVRNQEAINGGLSESLFERLNTPSATVTLRLNYRMNKPITDMANSLTYNGQLLTGNEEVANATLLLPNFENFMQTYKEQDWILKTLDQSLSASIRILDTGPVWKRRNTETSIITEESRCTNLFEIAILKTLVDALLEGGISNEAIGIIAPYRAQVSKLLISFKDCNIEISTVDQFQGRDKEIIFYSCTRSSCQRNSDVQSEILDDQRRLTVAVTRAKCKFIMIGDLDTIRQYKPFEKLLNSLDQSNFFKLTNGELGFNWNTLIDLEKC
ncbi:hypothetical protein RI129_010860 [Pyrocoelia pectoralis]|uniref:DNA replication ATP-dependent helicase/nuclease n=1 Tax=Pyrocoelia pectoralis TaxID=417401 RepID=A0AAN7VA27_9COLE